MGSPERSTLSRHRSATARDPSPDARSVEGWHAPGQARADRLRSASRALHPRTGRVLSLTRRGGPQKSEIATLVGAENLLRVEFGIAAFGVFGAGASAAARASTRHPRPGGRCGRFLTDSRMRSPLRTSASGPPDAASGVTCSTMVPKAVPLMRASETRIMSLTPLLRELLRDRQIAGLGHAFRRMRAGILQHQHVVRSRLRARDRRCAPRDRRAREHHRPALVLEQPRVGRRALEDGAPRREVAEQRDQPTVRLERLLARGNDRAVDSTRRRSPAARRSVSPVTVMQSRCSSGSSSRSSAPMPPAAKKSSI